LHSRLGSNETLPMQCRSGRQCASVWGQRRSIGVIFTKKRSENSCFQNDKCDEPTAATAAAASERKGEKGREIEILLSKIRQCFRGSLIRTLVPFCPVDGSTTVSSLKKDLQNGIMRLVLGTPSSTFWLNDQISGGIKPLESCFQTKQKMFVVGQMRYRGHKTAWIRNQQVKWHATFPKS
jgi:hypothetical protein